MVLAFEGLLLPSATQSVLRLVHICIVCSDLLRRSCWNGVRISLGHGFQFLNKPRTAQTNPRLINIPLFPLVTLGW